MGMACQLFINCKKSYASKYCITIPVNLEEVPMKLVRLINMYWNNTYGRVCADK
jgi:hypothetical protein